MINRELTIDSGLAEVGLPIDIFQLSIDADHPLMKALQNARSCIAEVINDPMIARIVQTMYGISLFDNKGNPASLKKDECDRFSHWEDLFVRYFNEGIKRIIPSVRECDALVAFFDIYDSINEALMNAIEHGTNFGHEGIVGVQWFLGQTKTLITITQSTAGPSVEILNDLINDPRRYDLGKGFMRGHGIPFHVSSKFTQANYCAIQGGGFAVVLLTTTADSE